MARRDLTPVVIDYETDSIEDRPEYPPKPVGVAILDETKQFTRGLLTKAQRKALKAKDTEVYLAWGHPAENNSTKSQGQRLLKDIYRSGRPVLMHHSKFDCDVGDVHLGLGLLPWERVHDTLFEIALDDPHAHTFSLKPSADRILGMKPTEQDALKDWIVSNVPGATAGNAGAHICKAPGDLVGRYAIGDVVRTWRIHQKLMPRFDKDKAPDGGPNMRTAYDRERRLMPILLENERLGMRVDVEQLRQDILVYEAAQEMARRWLEKRLRCKDFDPNDKELVADTLAKRGIIKDWVVTKMGKRSTAKNNMGVEKFRDKKLVDKDEKGNPIKSTEVASALGYWNRCQTVLSQSMRPWLAQAEKSNGRIYTSWNQVRQSKGDSDKTKGTKTFRMSCSRFMNIAKAWDDRDDGYIHPRHIPGGLKVKLPSPTGRGKSKTLMLQHLPTLPLVRKYILPERGHLMAHRDYNQQELRILAHFENDQLCAAYKADPWLDVHDYVRRLILEITGQDLPRRSVKVINFGKIYGMGARGVMEKLHCDKGSALKLISAHRKALPGVRELEREVMDRGKEGLPVREWGGGLIHCEPPMEHFNEQTKRTETWTWEYKMLNYLIQRSAASCTKEAIIRLHDHPRWKKLAIFMVAVHDEINSSSPKSAVKEALLIQRDVMASIEFDVPMLSDPKVGPSWGTLKKFDEPKMEIRKAA